LDQSLDLSGARDVSRHAFADRIGDVGLRDVEAVGLAGDRWKHFDNRLTMGPGHAEDQLGFLGEFRCQISRCVWFHWHTQRT
jgi:hypothetical protein